jgi:hypothetical protein
MNNAMTCNYRAVLDGVQGAERVLGYRPSFQEAAGLALSNFTVSAPAHVEKRDQLGIWRRIED